MKGPSLLFTLAAFALSTTSFAMQSMDDDALSEFVAQDGTTWTMNVNQSMDALRIVDKDGYTGATDPGQIMIKGMGLITCTETTILGACTPTTSGGLTIRFDAGSQTGGANPVLIAGINLAPKIRQHMAGLWLGDVDAASPTKRPTAGNEYQILMVNANAAAADADRYIDILTEPNSNLRMEMGNQPGGHLLTAGDLKIQRIEYNGGMAVCDSSAANCANALRMGTNYITGEAGGSIDFSGTAMGVTANGLYLTMGSNVKMDIVQGDIGLGAASNPLVGSTVIRGLDLSGATITMRGH